MDNHINIGTEEGPYWTPKLTEEQKRVWHDGVKQDSKPKVLEQRLEVTYTQGNDCTELSDLGQFLYISTANGGVGKEDDFFILETERWAIDNIEEFIETLKDFKSKYDRLNEVQ